VPGVAKMILIGELINATRKSISDAIAKKDAGYIKKIIASQIKAGATYIDLNAGRGKGQAEEILDMQWLVSIVNEFDYVGVCLDSSSPEVIHHCLPEIKSTEIMLNSITGEERKIRELLPVIKKHPGCNIISLTMDDSGIPTDVEKRLEISRKLVSLLENVGVNQKHIFIDALVQPVSTGSMNGVVFLESIKAIKNEFPSVMTTCGLSNISFGLPDRVSVNRYFLAIAISYGLDSAIADPCTAGLKESICIAEMLIGKDEYCMNYIRMRRESSK